MEDHNHYIDQRGHSGLRGPGLAIGERMADAGLLERPDDVFFLHRSEIRDVAARSPVDLKSLVASRRSIRDEWMGVLPPSVIGRDAAVPGDASDDGFVRGIAASAGVVTGRARVVLTLDDIDRLTPGDVLVTYATAPPWTPVFAYAAAVVTDAGGALSHCAVVAREYGIPAVVGAQGATSRIRDGALIEVDGTEGVIRLLA